MIQQGGLTPAMLVAVEAHLRESDPVIAGLIDQHGACLLVNQPYQPFHTLATSIISQQLSAKAAVTIERRVAQLVPAPFQPAAMVAAPVEQLRAAGLSSRKAVYLHELARRVIDGRLSFDVLADASDDAVIDALVELPGIGRWTAEMFLIFGLKRLDVLALDDAGLQRAVRLLYGDALDLARAGTAWRPYRSVASWYLWRHLDTG
jgi:DNA-3-methyladenine glycosylase II